MLLSFPAMHPALFAAPAVPGVLFFDPGLAPEEGAEGAWPTLRPADLPLDTPKLARLVEDGVRFGEQFANPREMAYAQASADQAAAPETTSAIRAEFEARLRADAGADKGDDLRAAQAQYVLALAWTHQQQLAESAGLSERLRQGWEHFGQALGLEGDEADARELELDRAVSGMNVPGAESGLPWRRALEALAVLLPDGLVLLASDAETATAWIQADDLAFGPAPSDWGLPAGWLGAEAPAWKLAGHARAPHDPGALGRILRAAVPSDKE